MNFIFIRLADGPVLVVPYGPWSFELIDKQVDGSAEIKAEEKDGSMVGK